MGTIPKNARVKEDRHLAEGEVTGHYHRAEADSATVFETGGLMILDAPEGTDVTHQEHGTVTLPAGSYQRALVNEWDPFEEEARAVID